MVYRFRLCDLRNLVSGLTIVQVAVVELPPPGRISQCFGRELPWPPASL